jgi:flagellar assembly protein FliH
MSADPTKLTAWERWEMASFDEARPPARMPTASAGASTPSSPAVVLPTASDIEQIHKQSQEQGYQAGYAEGLAKSRAEAATLAALVQQLDSALTDLDQQVAAELLALSVEIARLVIGQTLAVHPEAILDVVHAALAELPHQHAAIHLHPDDAVLVRMHMGEQLTHTGHRILDDVQVARGGCLIEAGGSQVDGALATRWRRVLESMGTPSEWIAADKP